LAAKAFSPAPPDGVGSNLLDPRTAALNQNDQNDDNQYTGNYPDKQCGVHKSLSLGFFLQLRVFLIPVLNAV
jgi:hypothetical protein